MKKVLALVLAVVMLFSLVACGGGEDSSGSDNSGTTSTGTNSGGGDTGELTKLTISHHPALHGLPAYAAIEKGFFEEEGLDVEMIVYIAGAVQMEALPSGTWQCGGGGATAGVVGTIGYDLQMLGYVGWDGPIDIYVREDSDIYQAGKGHVDGYPEIYGTAENWKGKEFLLPQGTTAHLALLGTLDALGLESTDVQITHMEVPAAQTAFRAGEGDAVGQWINFALTAQKYGWKKVSSCEDAGVNIPLVLFASDEIINSDPDTVVKYIKAYIKTWYWLADNPDEALELYYQYLVENGVETTEEDCKELLATYVPESIDDMLAYYEVDPETGKTPYVSYLETMLNYFVEIGNYTQEQADLALSDEKMNTELMVQALTELKEEGVGV